ncbi:putative acyl-CoA binding protein [Leptomonas pyrrhocoris]|uniref:Putative acyl-CoA binding protein n=1 Tax=Leptomonas pyrrhocoris TaxID=157538 RepID=A0A0N0DWY9_LEPPY|nr:putative acyl-CoA binding protein [Leptomonas pyrrhocoris]KPA82332.1 putative acyl-CoA binding protein [Leptomonas pyrrhocoris]|eukprot:XP_015660771.1 putative acyl-CoA binding protein [Leptomonas pyrrhocoris]
MSAAEFEKYEKLISPLRSKLSISQKIEMYGLWCVAARGKCTRRQPFRANLLEYGKWKAWKRYENLSQEEARAQFIAKSKALLKSHSSKL